MNCNIPTIVKSSLAEKFERDWTKYQIFFFSAPCGFGKTTTAMALLERRSVCVMNALDADFLESELNFNCDAVLIDDLQAVKEAEDQKKICAMISEHAKQRFVFLSRGAPPGWLSQFRFDGLMRTFDERDLFFDLRDIRSLFDRNGLTVTNYELSAIHRRAKGYPLLVSILADYMGKGLLYSEALIQEARQEIFFYYEEAIYHRLDAPLRNLLLDLAAFDRFDLEMAMMISGDSHVGEMLGRIQKETSMISSLGSYEGDRWQFWPLFHSFLLWESEQLRSEEERNAIYTRAALYHELHEDYEHAMECYVRCKKHRKVSELLIKHSNKHPGSGSYYELEKYYRALPRSEILSSPVLIAGMSMLCAVCMEYEESEKWYRELESFAAGLKRTNADYKEARSRLAYLDIALPQRGVSGLSEIIPKVFTIMKNKQISLPEFSVTSTLPSIMNGGKDFCAWSKKDDFLYATIRPAVEAVLGRDGVGLADCAIAESKFEKGENISERLLGLVALLGDVQRRGTPDIEFALVGLLARAQCDQGKAAEARHTLEMLRMRFEEAGLIRFRTNIDAMLCRIDLRLGSMDAVEEWRREKSPRDLLRFRGMHRYQYMTLAMVEISRGEYEAAKLVLAPLESYCKICERVMDEIHFRLLSAICDYRKKNEEWREHLHTALDYCFEYSFTHPASEYGAAILPLLVSCGWKGEADFLHRIISDARAQAVYYPDFLRSALPFLEPLSQAEQQVLRLLCHDKSNAEIGEILGIKLSTVKTHVSKILQKLGVKRRSEAKAAAEKLGLI